MIYINKNWFRQRLLHSEVGSKSSLIQSRWYLQHVAQFLTSSGRIHGISQCIPDITKASSNYCFITLFYGKCTKTIVDFICASKNTRQTHQPATSLKTIQVLALFSHRCITCTDCAWYNLHISLESRLYKNHACSRNHVNSQNKQGLLANQNADSEYKV